MEVDRIPECEVKLGIRGLKGQSWVASLEGSSKTTSWPGRRTGLMEGRSMARDQARNQ